LNSVYQQFDRLTTRRLESFNQEWTLYLQKLNTWQEALSRRSQNLEDAHQRLGKMVNLWQNTQQRALDEGAPEAIRERIKAIADEIGKVDEQLTERVGELLTLQDRISQQQIEISELITLINKTEAELQSRLFVPDSPPLWQAFQAREDSLHFGKQIKISWGDFLRTNLAFVKANEDRFYLHLVIFVLLFALMVYFQRRNKRSHLLDEHDEILKASAFFLSRPLSAALLIALFLSVWIYPSRTSTVGEFILLLLLVPVLRILPGIVMPALRKPIYFLAGLYLLDLLQKISLDYVVLHRLLLLLLAVLSFLLFAWVIRPGSEIHEMQLRFWPKLVLRLSFLVLVLLLISIVSNIVGSVSLAEVLTAGVVESVTTAAALYAIVLVSDGLIALLIRRRSARALQTVKIYEQQLERRAIFVIHLIAFIIWFRMTLRVFGLLKPLRNWFAEILAFQWKFGTITVSVQGVIDFLLILVAAFILARVIRVFLDMEVFSRVRLPRGIPGAISMVVRYTIAGLGIFLALSSLGINLGKFGLLAGALGVGLGFGLQNIIANFVSGIILAFERPIQVGDTIEIGNVMGNVQEIGVRSSTVKTFDGSEVIVPNANLISDQVTNWTLSDARRRIQLPVKVAFGNDPHQVLDLLLKVAREHPEVLKSPEPIATFNGFGDNFLDFTLYYWISGNIFKNKTEVALGVHDAIKAAGIETPRPQRDLNLKIIDNPDKKRILDGGDKKKDED
jgi:small-conductance mechanosensitive channel